VPEFFAAHALAAVVMVVMAGLAAMGLWFIFGPNARRRRALHHAENLLRLGQWRDALIRIQRLQARSGPSAYWTTRLRKAEHECYLSARTAALEARDFDNALEYSRKAVRVSKAAEEAALVPVLKAILAELRRISGAGNDIQTARALADRALQLKSPCPEASFWLALCLLRSGDKAQAMAALEAARCGDTSPALSNEPQFKPSYIDPSLYLGAILLRDGEAKAALRYLTEANRIDGNCPFVVAQLGSAMIEAGGDAQLAVRALQRALGPRGFSLWMQNPRRAWVESFPEKHSFIRQLPADQPFVCPLWGADLQTIVRVSCISLGRGMFQLGQFQEASEVFQKALQEGAPSLPIVRGLGLALARLGQYDQAFKHLQLASHMEQTQDRITTGYLALCGARGTPTRPEDKIENVSSAIRLISPFTAPGDAEWAGLASAIFAEARAIGLVQNKDDQLYLCEHLASVHASDAAAADGFHHLQATYPEAVRSEYAWLFCRAAQAQGAKGPLSLSFFARTFTDPGPARAYFAEQGWDFDALEITYLERAAELDPGHFPLVLGADYAARGERLLLERSIEQQKVGDLDAALETVNVLLRLAPGTIHAHDRAAHLHYLRNERAMSLEYLRRWEKLDSANPLPPARQAILLQELGETEQCLAAVRRGLAQSEGRVQAGIAFLGARLLLKTALAQNSPADCAANLESPDVRSAMELLEDCLHHEPQHTGALQCLAYLRSAMKDDPGLARQSQVMKSLDSARPEVDYAAALCHVAANELDAARAASRRAQDLCAETSQGVLHPRLAVESAFLEGWAAYLQQDWQTATQALHFSAGCSDCPSAAVSQALLGKIAYLRHSYEEAVHWWKSLNAKWRSEWNFSQALAGSVFLSALDGMRAEKYEEAAEKLREAGRLGWRDRRLGLLLTLCMVKAGQQSLYDPLTPNPEQAARFFEQALKLGCHEAPIAYILAACYKRLGRFLECRAALKRIARPDASVYLQMGLAAFADGDLAQAAQDFLRAREMDPARYAAGYNLFLTHLRLGEMAEAAGLIRELLPLCASVEEQRFLALLEPLLRSISVRPAQPPLADGAQSNGRQVHDSLLNSMTAADEQRLIELISGLGRLEVSYPLLRRLAAVRPGSVAIQDAYLDVVLLQALHHADRCQWEDAREILVPLCRETALTGSHQAPARPSHVALLNMAGCCVCMLQDFELGHWFFEVALSKARGDAWIQQNMALSCEWRGRFDQAEQNWNRYFALLGSDLPIAPVPDYWPTLTFEGLSRLGDVFSKRDLWKTSLNFLERALRLRPGDADILERLFHAYNQTNRSEDARRTLKRLKEVRPNDPQFELYEFDVRDLRTIDQLDRMLGDLRKTLNRYPNDMRVEERVATMTATSIAFIERKLDQVTRQLNKVTDQMRRLPSYQIDWSAVRDVMHDLEDDLFKLRRSANKCLGLVNQEAQRRSLRDLIARIDRKMEICHGIGS
jgi:tetratricopeptide (TPR) repeat protein